MRLLINGIDTECDVSVSGCRALDRKLARRYRDKARDFQRQRLYDWENARFPAILDRDAPKLDIAECAALVRIACRAFGMRRIPEVRDGRGARRASGSPQRIKLPRWARSPHVVLHETAHAIARYHAPQSAAHGREFCATYAALLAKYCGYNEAELVAQMRAAGLKVAPKLYRKGE